MNISFSLHKEINRDNKRDKNNNNHHNTILTMKSTTKNS